MWQINNRNNRKFIKRNFKGKLRNNIRIFGTLYKKLYTKIKIYKTNLKVLKMKIKHKNVKIF